MGERNDALLARLMALKIGPDDAALSFEARLARDNGWNAAFTRRVMTEYRRFLYLAATASAGQAATPSEAVDQAWHLHLTYSRDYWEGLCRDVIGRPLHHGPTAGGVVESDRYRRQYDATLARYAALFGAPPVDVWPDVETRFSARMRWVDTRRHFVLPRLPAMAGGAACCVSLLAACTSENAGRQIGFMVFVAAFITIISVMTIRILMVVRAPVKEKKQEKDGRGCGATSGGCGSGSSDHSHSGGDGGCGGGCGGD